jgi:hypothetical protein
MGCLLAYKDPISFLIIRANGPTCRANRPDTAKRQRSILSFFGNTNGPTQQKTTKSYEYWMFCLSNVQSLLLCYIYYFFKTLIKYNGLQTLESLIFTWFTNSKDTYIFYRLWIHSSLPASFIPRTKTFNFVHYRNIHFSIPIIFNILHFLDSGFTTESLPDSPIPRTKMFNFDHYRNIQSVDLYMYKYRSVSRSH